MKRKLFIAAAFLIAVFVFTGCSNYDEIDRRLSEIKIENKLPKLTSEKYTTMEDAEDAVYDQQIGACEMLSDIAEQTDYRLYEVYGGRQKKVIEKCSDKRSEVAQDIESLFKENIYSIMADVEDCPNVDAYVDKTFNNVKTFFDEYNNYKTSENADVALTDILTYYYDRKNVLAKSFLTRNREEVYDASVAVIKGNAQTDDDFRFYINKNNIIIKGLNEIYGGVPSKYANDINEAGNKLAANLLDSLENLTAREKKTLMDELGLTTATPSPTASPTPSTPTPLPTPNVPTDAPTARPTPTPTPRPTPTPTPRPTPTPTPTPAPAPEQSTQTDNSADSGDSSNSEPLTRYVIE